MYQKYQNARDATWQLLIDTNTSALPIKITKIVRQLGIACCSYKEIQTKLPDLGIGHYEKKGDGFTFNHNGTYYIFYNQDCTQQRCRFTIAHELGHIMLGHVKENCYTTVNREPWSTDNEDERQANIFASRLLAPSCVLWGLNISSTEDIARVCDISIISARFRYQRLKVLYARNKFLTSPLERLVFQNFGEFIRNHLRAEPL